VAFPTRVTGQPDFTLVFRDTVSGVAEVGKSSTKSVTYLEGRYLWGEVVTQIGDAVYGSDRDSSGGNYQAQRLPPYLQLSIQFSDALLKNAIRAEDRGNEDFRPDTGEFWVGRFRCGSALPAESSPYHMTVRLLEDGQEIARQRFVIGVLTDTSCVEGTPDGSLDRPLDR
jgi:hypothetical protein